MSVKPEERRMSHGHTMSLSRAELEAAAAAAAAENLVVTDGGYVFSRATGEVMYHEMTMKALQEVASMQQLSHIGKSKDDLVQMLELNDIALGGNDPADHEVQGSNISISTITGYPLYGAADVEHLRTAARNRGLCTNGGMALLIRVLEMDDAIKNRNLDSQAGPYISGNGQIFSSITGKVPYHNMSEKELRSECIDFDLLHAYVGLDKDY